MNAKIKEFLENELEFSFLENTNSNNLILKTDMPISLVIEYLESEFISNDELLLEITFLFEISIKDYIKLNKSEYLIILENNY